MGLLATAGMTVTTPASLAEASGSYPRFALASFTASAEPIAATAVADADEVSADVREAIADADTAIAAADDVAGDIAASGLDLGVSETTVDTAALEAAVERLEAADSLPAPLVPALTDDVTALVASVDGDVSGLRGSLDAAIAKKAEQEAAAQAKREAEAAAPAAAEAQAAAEAEAEAEATAPAAPSAPAPSAPVPTGGGTGDNSPAGAQASAYGMLGNYGWGDDQFGCLVSLWNKESGWNYQAYNSSSGAYGIPQALPGSKMGTAGADWQTNAATQVAWGLGYIAGRYGSPCGAWSHSESVGWY
ncbi:lytic transglycosylase domain-containing protein [Microbacterium sp. CFBP9034]|uniref:aggregation-promoting factor C-terminal-like domain-containing protein n=1 Tax=Microbacterium sp. CFBP9034 TaxID=3096540 RepID=UPI002A6A9323|nr:lytic transglycosylase domain-containing protein [Microbacterium sp. CFBP9034]MDY0910688.1 lytic transglycosylase domain-containing protein [Microbacterium sp. CFBP9034]